MISLHRHNNFECALCISLFDFRISFVVDQFEWNIWLYGCKQSMHTTILTIESEQKESRNGQKKKDWCKKKCVWEKYSNKLSNTHGKRDGKDDKMRLTLLLYYYMHVALNTIALKVNARICIWFIDVSIFHFSHSLCKRICAFPRLWQFFFFFSFFWLHVFFFPLSFVALLIHTNTDTIFKLNWI